jgi:addiction module HigA family antidote
MSAYRDALTRMFLKGAFPARSAARENPPARATQIARRPSAATITEEKPMRRAVRQSSPTGSAAPVAEGSAFPHPGRRLAERLAAHRLTASDLARDIGVPVNRVTALINGQRGVTADTALRLGRWFDEPPESWMDAQQKFELARARAAAGDGIARLPRLADRLA